MFIFALIAGVIAQDHTWQIYSRQTGETNLFFFNFETAGIILFSIGEKVNQDPNMHGQILGKNDDLCLKFRSVTHVCLQNVDSFNLGPFEPNQVNFRFASRDGQFRLWDEG